MYKLLFLWRIPPELQEEFRREWTELTLENKRCRGLIDASLFLSENHAVSITTWESERVFGEWREELRSDPRRTRWRPYQLTPPQVVQRIVNV
jgi:heme-degrading monooxygenase HmoA